MFLVTCPNNNMFSNNNCQFSVNENKFTKKNRVSGRAQVSGGQGHLVLPGDLADLAAVGAGGRLIEAGRPGHLLGRRHVGRGAGLAAPGLSPRVVHVQDPCRLLGSLGCP